MIITTSILHLFGEPSAAIIKQDNGIIFIHGCTVLGKKELFMQKSLPTSIELADFDTLS